MRFHAYVTAALLPLSIVALQIPIIEGDKYSEVINDSLFLSLHRSLCTINSVTNEENEVGIWLQLFLEAHHFKVTTQEVAANPGQPEASKPRLNIYAEPDPEFYKDKNSKSDVKHTKSRASHNSPKVLLTSHIDTVVPYIDYSLSYNGSSKGEFDRSKVLIRGRGTVDDKACVASQITAAMELLEHPPPGLDFSPTDIALFFEVDEESGGDGMVVFSDSDLYKSTSKNYKAILFGEPTENRLVAGHKGIFGMSLRAEGKAAHSGYPELGSSANSKILPVLSALDVLDRVSEEQGGFPVDPKFGRTTVNVGYIRGGVAANVVPNHAEASVAFRLASGTVESNQKIIDQAIAAADPNGDVKYEYREGYGPVELDTDVDGFEDPIIVNYGTDIPLLDVKDGVKRYLYGPGSIFVAHGDDEGLMVGDLEAGLEGYRKLLAHALQL